MAIKEAVAPILKEMDRHELEQLVDIIDLEGFHGLVENGGDQFRELASKVEIPDGYTLLEIIEEIYMMKDFIYKEGYKILYEEDN